MSALTDGETEAWEAGRLTQGLTQCAHLLQVGVCWPPEPALFCHHAWAGREGSKPRTYLIHPWGKDTFVPAQMCSQTARLWRRRPTSQRGTLRWRGRGRLLRKSPGRMGEEFPPFHNDPPSLPCGALPPKGPRATATRTADISCGAAPPTAPSPVPAGNVAAGRGHWPHLGWERKRLSEGD